jgi:hypothetical protein
MYKIGESWIEVLGTTGGWWLTGFAVENQLVRFEMSVAEFVVQDQSVGLEGIDGG